MPDTQFMSNTRYFAVLAAASLLTWVMWSQSAAAAVPATFAETASRTVEKKYIP
jgi:hypothetical protein